MTPVFRFFAERHTLATLFTIMIVLLGVKTLWQINRAQFPDVDMSQMVIVTRYPGASPEDVELNVTNKIESNLKGVSGIKSIRSTSFENLSTVIVSLKADVTDVDKVKAEVREAVGRVTDFPPEVTESPYVEETTTAIFPIIEVGIAGDMPYSELRKFALRFEKKLKNIPGVSKAVKYGYRAREIHVEVKPDKIRQYQVPLYQIINAIKARNIKATGGTLESYTSEKNVVTLAQFRYPMEVGDVIVRSSNDGTLIKVKDLAIVRDGFEEERSFSRLKGIKAISFIVAKTATGDVIRTVDAIKKLAKEEQKNFGGKIEFLYALDVSKKVRNQFEIVRWNGLIGLGLVLLVLTIFLNLRTAFWVAAGIPISLLGVTFLLPFFGVSLDSITLTSMVLVIGIIVDDGIIVSENIYQRREKGDSPLDAAVNGLKEVFSPVITTVLTTFLAFAPMFFMPGMLGKFVYVIPLTVSLALFISMFEVVIALPAHLVPGLKRYQISASSNGKAAGSRRKQTFATVKNGFEKFCLAFLKWRYVLVIIAVFGLASALFYAKNSMDFILFSSKGAADFYIEVELPMGTPLEGTSKMVKRIEDEIIKLPPEELEAFGARIGRSAQNLERENVAVLIVHLTPFNKRVRTADQIVEEIRGKTDQFTGFKKIKYHIDTGGPPTGKPVSIRVISSNDTNRKQLADVVVETLESIQGVKDIERDDKLGKDQVEIILDYEWLAILGLTVSDVAQNIRIAYDGQVVTSVRYGEEDVNFRVEIEKRYRKRLNYLMDMLIPNKQGELIALKRIAKLSIGPGPSAFLHFDGERTITITADIDQDHTTPAKVHQFLKAQLNPERDFPETRLFFGGQAQESDEAMISLMLSFVVALLGIYFLLVLLFNSFTQPALVLFSIPFGIICVIGALAVHGAPISFMAMIGTIGLTGVIVNDALVLVNHLNQLRKDDPDGPLFPLIAAGTANRLRPILLTTISTVAGLVPLTYGFGGMDLYMAPLAMTLGYGLLLATPLTLILIPCLYAIGADLSRLTNKLKQRIRK